MAVHFDKSYWPQCGTVVPAIPQDLDDLWDANEDQASIFVAEAIISNEPQSQVDLEDGKPKVQTFLWAVGGDTLTVEASLPELIEESARVYECIRSDAQEEDVRERLSALNAIEESVAAAKSFLNGQLTRYREADSANATRDSGKNVL